MKNVRVLLGCLGRASLCCNVSRSSVRALYRVKVSSVAIKQPLFVSGFCRCRFCFRGGCAGGVQQLCVCAKVDEVDALSAQCRNVLCRIVNPSAALSLNCVSCCKPSFLRDVLSLSETFPPLLSTCADSLSFYSVTLRHGVCVFAPRSARKPR